MSEADRERWNERYLEAEPTPDPSPFLVGLDELLPRRGRALDVAGGTGRHALWLARRGLAVTLADVSDVAVFAAARSARAAGLPLETLRIDLQTSPFPPGPWDLVVCFYFLDRNVYRAFAPALAPGGLVVVAQATRTNLTRRPRPGPQHLLDDGEMPSLLAGLEIVAYREGWFEEGRHEARIVARRPHPGVGVGSSAPLPGEGAGSAP